MSQEIRGVHWSGGPVSSMPGSSHAVPEGIMCDKHDNVPAVHRIQGETDSMGCEYACMCAECHKDYLEEKAKLDGGSHLGSCPDCGAREVPLFSYRDYEEGSCGPLYYACRSCKSAAIKRQNESLDDEDYSYEGGEFYDDSDFDD